MSTTELNNYYWGKTGMKIGNQAWQTIVNNWFYHIEEGDKIVFGKNEAVLFNGSGCELDRISLIH